MKVTQQELFNLIKNAKPNQMTYPSESHMLAVITEKLQIEENEQLRTIIKSQLMLCKRQTADMNKKSAANRTTVGDPNLDVIDTDDFTKTASSSTTPVHPEPSVKKYRKKN